VARLARLSTNPLQWSRDMRKFVKYFALYKLARKVLRRGRRV